MRIPTRTNRQPVSANMTPMIDVVFLLIIFFLVSSHLARQENRLPLDLPHAQTAGSQDPYRSSLTVTVDANSRWLVGGDQVNQSQLQSIFADHVRREGPASSLRIRTDRSVQYRYVEPILRAAAGVGLSNAAISVRQHDTGRE